MDKGERLVTDVVKMKKEEKKTIRWKDPDSRGKDPYLASISERVRERPGPPMTQGDRRQSRDFCRQSP